MPECLSPTGSAGSAKGDQDREHQQDLWTRALRYLHTFSSIQNWKFDVGCSKFRLFGHGRL